MKAKSNRSIYMLVKCAKAVAVFLAGGILVHMLYMFIDCYLMPASLHLNLKSDFIGSLLSPGMIPMMAAYGFCLPGAYFSWIKAQNAMSQAYQREVQRQEAEQVIRSLQRVTGILAQHLSAHNAEIMHWVETRKQKLGSAPDRIERSSRKIAETLQALSVGTKLA